MTRIFNNYLVGRNLLKAQQISEDRTLFTHESRDYTLETRNDVISILPSWEIRKMNWSNIRDNDNDFMIPWEVWLVAISKHFPWLGIQKVNPKSWKYLYFYNFKTREWMTLKLNSEVYDRLRTNLWEIENILSIDDKTQNFKILTHNN